MNEQVRGYLIQVARSPARTPVTYSQVNQNCGLGLDFEFQTDRNEIGRILGEIGTYEFNNGRPILSALVVHQGEPADHGVGFYNLCDSLGVGDARRLRDRLFGYEEMTRCFDYWQNAT
jgi:hypothetical protein